MPTFDEEAQRISTEQNISLQQAYRVAATLQKLERYVAQRLKEIEMEEGQDGAS